MTTPTQSKTPRNADVDIWIGLKHAKDILVHGDYAGGLEVLAAALDDPQLPPEVRARFEEKLALARRGIEARDVPLLETARFRDTAPIGMKYESPNPRFWSGWINLTEDWDSAIDSAIEALRRDAARR